MKLSEARQLEQEMQKVLEQATQGNWIPFGISLFLICIIVVLLMHIYNMRLKHIDRRQKDSDAKHDKHYEMLKELKDGNAKLSTIIAVHESEINHVKGVR